MTTKVADETEFQARMAMPGNQFNATTLRNIAGLGLGAFGLAAALRGLKGTRDIAADAVAPAPTAPLRRRQAIVVPVRAADDEDGPYKAAADACRELTKSAHGWGVETAGRALDAVGLLKDQGGQNWGPGKDTLMNYGAKSVGQIPAAVWAAPLAIGGGAYLGHKLTDSLLSASKTKEDDSELSTAKRDYEQALAQTAGHKMAEEGGDAIDRLYEKRANMLGPLNGPLGGYLLAASLLAGGAGTASYNWARGRSEDKAVGDALKQRREQMFAGGPPPIYVVPQPVASRKPPAQPSLPEEPRKKRQLALPAPVKTANTAEAASNAIARLDSQREQLTQRTMSMLGIKPDEPKADKPQEVPAAPPLPSVTASI